MSQIFLALATTVFICFALTACAAPAPTPTPTPSPTAPPPTATGAPAATGTPTATATAIPPTATRAPSAIPTGTSTQVPQTFEQSLIWTREFGTDLTDSIANVASDKFGNIYTICACTIGQPAPLPYSIPGVPAGARATGLAITLRKYTGSGELVWDRILGGSLGYPSDGSVAADGAGSVFAIWPSKIGSTYQLAKFDDQGNPIWSNSLTLFALSALAPDGEGGVYVVGERPAPALESILSKYSATGTEVWTRNLAQGANGVTLKVAVGGDESPYVAGSLSGALPGQPSMGGWDIFIQKFTSQGDPVWARQLGSPANDLIADAAVDPSGNLYVAYLNDHLGLTKFDAGGNLIWSKPQESAKRVKLATDQKSLYVLSNHNWPVSPSNAEVRKLDLNGDPIWVRQFPSAWRAEPELIAADQDGNIFLGGEASAALPGQTYAKSGDVFLLKQRP